MAGLAAWVQLMGPMLPSLMGHVADVWSAFIGGTPLRFSNMRVYVITMFRVIPLTLTCVLYVLCDFPD